MYMHIYLTKINYILILLLWLIIKWTFTNFICNPRMRISFITWITILFSHAICFPFRGNKYIIFCVFTSFFLVLAFVLILACIYKAWTIYYVIFPVWDLYKNCIKLCSFLAIQFSLNIMFQSFLCLVVYTWNSVIFILMQ